MINSPTVKLQSLLLFAFMGFSACKTQSPALKKDTKIYIQNCANAINELKNGDSIPAFLFEPCLDVNVFYWANMHRHIPLRKLIVSRVNNLEALSYLLSVNDSRLKGTCTAELNKDTTGLYYYRIPFVEVSFENLLRYRRDELRNKMRY